MRVTLATALHVVLHVLLPAACPGCGAALRPACPPFGLCLRCRGQLRLATAPGSCPVCGSSREGPAGPCPDCRAHPPPYLRLIAPWSYHPPLEAAIKGLKYRRLEHLGAALAAPLAEALRACLAETGRGESRGGGGAGAGGGDLLVVPVPLHWRRRLARGYDQAERIARPLARRLGADYAAVLVRRRATRPQTSLPRELRRRNLRHAFTVRHRRRRLVAGRRLLLVDDVATTGATLGAAARALRAAGARVVIAAAVARTPPPGGRQPRSGER